MKHTRTRFAPSPTGFLHIGAVRTALFAWLVAKGDNGEFILRIEDTDKKREVEGATNHIMESLRWLGLDWDEGPDSPGEYGPYTQSERLEVYSKYANQLIEQGLAYADPTSKEELDKLRDKAKKEKRPFRFREHRPEKPTKWEKGIPLRFKIDAQKSPDWHDLVRGNQEGTTENIDDFIIIKADGYPTYNFAHIIDDHEMKITHVIRGDEFISSMPKFLLLYKALGFETPKFAHVPPILAPEGNKKLSKRDGAGDILEYRDKGYLPESMTSFLATLGWNDGTEQEIFTQDELIEKFSLDRVQKSGSHYDSDRLDWINGQKIRELDLEQLYKLSESYWPNEASEYDKDYRIQVLELVKDRLSNLSEIDEYSEFFFKRPEVGLNDLPKKSPNLNQTKQYLQEVIATLKNLEQFDQSSIKRNLMDLIKDLDTKPGILLPIIRVVITGTMASPPLYATIELLGKEESINRLEDFAS